MKTIKKAVEASINVKKSNFIARIYPAKNKSQVKEIINDISTKYGDATHNCTAHIVSDSRGYDDDGEPSGTAGKPMINVLEKNDLSNIVAIVTRYFGGVKLGAGGLVRAYSHAVLTALEEAEIVNMESFNIYEALFDYRDIKDIEAAFRKYNINIIKKDYAQQVSYTIASNNKDIIKTISEKYQNNLVIKDQGIEYLEVN
ncbi:YigZ family protein [uncultured Methanobrevibacter sp.]|uniref:YigZ family protein n=1 Tax=uncultured Methanobrevibacter sp. TaxID=253161 RepID=UPI0025F194D2|nr:YigZ family protein [uncultured Methanobrevibacter sp.]